MDVASALPTLPAPMMATFMVKRSSRGAGQAIAGDNLFWLMSISCGIGLLLSIPFGSCHSEGMADAPRRRPKVGAQIRRRRQDRALTLAGVAQLTGLNGGYLS